MASVEQHCDGLDIADVNVVVGTNIVEHLLLQEVIGRLDVKVVKTPLIGGPSDCPAPMAAPRSQAMACSSTLFRNAGVRGTSRQ